MDAASDLISNIQSYQQLLTTLGLGVSAGAFALATQVIFHNAKENRKIILRTPVLIPIGIFLEFVSILFGILTRGALVASIPALHSITWGTDSATEQIKTSGFGQIALFSELQIVFFAFGVIAIVALMIVNWRILTGIAVGS